MAKGRKQRTEMVEVEGEMIAVLKNEDKEDEEAAVQRAKNLKDQANSLAMAFTGKRRHQVAGRDYKHQDHCQQCWDGGELVICDHCPASWSSDWAQQHGPNGTVDGRNCAIIHASLSDGGGGRRDRVRCRRPSFAMLGVRVPSVLARRTFRQSALQGGGRALVVFARTVRAGAARPAGVPS